MLLLPPDVVCSGCDGVAPESSPSPPVTVSSTARSMVAKSEFVMRGIFATAVPPLTWRANTPALRRAAHRLRQPAYRAMLGDRGDARGLRDRAVRRRRRARDLQLPAVRRRTARRGVLHAVPAGRRYPRRRALRDDLLDLVRHIGHGAVERD